MFQLRNHMWHIHTTHLSQVAAPMLCCHLAVAESTTLGSSSMETAHVYHCLEYDLSWHKIFFFSLEHNLVQSVGTGTDLITKSAFFS